jgi:hypothetical protein
MAKEFDSPSNRKTREETRKRTEYADSKIEPGLASLIDQVHILFSDRVYNIPEGAPLVEVDRIFNECMKKVWGAREAFEIWDKLFAEYKPPKRNGSKN